MSAVVAHPMARLAEYRAITARPELHSEEVVIDACDQLMMFGDWMDHERGQALLRCIAAEAAAELNLRAEAAARRARTLARLRIACVIAVNCLGTLLLAHALWSALFSTGVH